MKRRLGKVLLLVFACLSLAGCLGVADTEMTVDGVMKTEAYTGNYTQIRNVALCSLATVILVTALVAMVKFLRGKDPGKIVDVLFWIFAGAYLTSLAGSQSDFAPDRIVRKAAEYVESMVRPSAHTGVGPIILDRFSRWMTNKDKFEKTTDENPPDMESAVGRANSAVRSLLSMPAVAGAFAIHSSTAIAIRRIMEYARIFMLVLWSMVSPLVAVCLIYPDTRKVFWGWLKVYVTLSVWGILLALSESVISAMFQAWSTTYSGQADPFTQVYALVQEMSDLAMINIFLWLVYLGMPAAAYAIVSATGKPFRDR